MTSFLRSSWLTSQVLKVYCAICVILVVGYFSVTVDHEYGREFIASILSSNARAYHRNKVEGFVALDEEGVFSFKNVCIEVRDSISKHVFKLHGFLPFIEKKTLTVYSSEAAKQHGKVTKTFTVAGRWISMRWWSLTLADGPVPLTHRFHDVGAAYFIAPTFPGNLHHFWEDEFLPLWNAMKRTNRLRQLDAVYPLNAVVYRLPYHLIREEHSNLYNVTRYEPILQTLGIERTQEVFWQKPTNTCYSNAVFGSAWIPLANVTKRDAVAHVIASLLGKNAGKRHYVTLIQRRNRRFINVGEMLRVAKEVVGDDHARVVDLEDYDVIEQLKVMAETCILIGVNGAGLQWAMFLSETYGASKVENVTKAKLIEVGWPRKFWDFYYKTFSSEYGIDYVQLEVTPDDVYPNWTSYERVCCKGHKVSDAERKWMLSPSFSPNPGSEHIWKWSDVVVDVNRLRKLLRETKCGNAGRP